MPPPSCPTCQDCSDTAGVPRPFGGLEPSTIAASAPPNQRGSGTIASGPAIRIALVRVHHVRRPQQMMANKPSVERSAANGPIALTWAPPRCLLGVAVCLISLLAFGAAGCGSSGHHGSTSPTLPATSTTTPASVTTATTTSLPTTPPSRSPFAAISGSYVAGTADGGWLYIRPDGAARLRGPDGVACPACATAADPIASLDFSLASITGDAGSTYTAEGNVTGTSDPTWASGLSAPATVGSPVSLSVKPTGRLTLNLLPGNVVLRFASKRALYSKVSPCTVQAVTPPIVATSDAAQKTVAAVTCSSDGEWAAASVAVKEGTRGFHEVVVLAGNGSTWIVVDRPTVCNGHDITPAFYTTACST